MAQVLFDSDENIKFVEKNTLRTCYWDTPYNPDKFEIRNGKIRCKQEVTDVYADDLPLMHYYSRDMEEHSVTDISEMFRDCIHLKSVDISNWDVSTVTNIEHLFYNCPQLAEFQEITDISDLDVSSVSNIGNAFHDCECLHTVDISNW